MKEKKDRKCVIKGWKLEDAAKYIKAMLSADKAKTFAFAITSIIKPLEALAFFDVTIFISGPLKWDVILVNHIGGTES